MTTYGVIGVGSLAAAIVTGLCDGVDAAPPVVLSPRSAGTAAALAARFETVSVAADNQAVVDAADVVVVAVLPDQVAAVLGALALRADQVVLSVVAGLRLATARELVAPATRVALAIPLPSVALRQGGIPVHPVLPEAVDFWSRLGEVVATDDEAVFDALVVPATTIAAHLEQLGVITQWVVDRGVVSSDARRYVGAVYAALGAQVAGDDDFGDLAAEVATPGGLNAQVADELRAAGVPAAVRSALDSVHQRLVQT